MQNGFTNGLMRTAHSRLRLCAKDAVEDAIEKCYEIALTGAYTGSGT